MSSESPDPFSTLDPKDGFHVVQVDVGSSVSLHCQAYGGGELFNMLLLSDTGEDATVELTSWNDPDAAAYGASTRLQLVLDAVARYLTTGGQWEELEGCMRVMRTVACGGLVFHGYHLVDSYSTTEGTYQHIFAKDDGSGRAVLWEEPSYTKSGGVVGGFLDTDTDLETLLAQQESDEDTGEEEETPPGPATPQLPDH